MAKMRKLLAGGGQPLVNYNFTDIAAGTGVIEFYAGVASGANIISNNKFYSNSVVSYLGTITSGAFLKIGEKDFDVLFNKPQNLYGRATINVPLGIKNPSGSTVIFYAFAQVKIYKWNGSTETLLTTEASPTWTTPGILAGAIESREMLITPTIPLSHFKKGETLRVTVEGWAGRPDASGDASVLLMAHDPENRITVFGDTYSFNSGEPTILKVQIPIKIDT